MTKERVKPFITSRNRLDLLADLAHEHTERLFKAVSEVVERAIDFDIPKKDGKDGSKDAGEGGFWDKKDGKDGKEKDGKEGKEGKESKDGKEGKEGKDSKDGKEGKEGKESKDGKESKEGKEGSKDGSKDGKDKDGKDKDDDGGKLTGSENELFRYGDELILPAEAFNLISEIHSVRLTALLNQPIF